MNDLPSDCTKLTLGGQHIVEISTRKESVVLTTCGLKVKAPGKAAALCQRAIQFA
jgi:hypothetical protein